MIERDVLINCVSSLLCYFSLLFLLQVAARLQQAHGGWTKSMARLVGKSGTVCGIDEHGTATVDFDGITAHWNPLLLLKAVKAVAPLQPSGKLHTGHSCVYPNGCGSAAPHRKTQVSAQNKEGD